jgi:hypothetical protein
MRTEQRGARWLARQAPPRYPLSDCMGDRAFVEWWLVLKDFGLI